MTTPGSRPDGLFEAERFLGESLEVVAPLTGGEDARVFRVRSAGGDRVLRVSYEGRDPEQVQWVSEWVDHVSATVPQAVRRERRGLQSFFRTAEGGIGTLLPFVEGVRPRRRDPGLVTQAADLLAGIHLAGLEWEGRPRGTKPRGPRRASTPEALRDPSLDEAWRGALTRGLHTGPLHGDYYVGNLLERDGSVVAILDFDEARIAPLLLETAGAIFEFSRDEEHRLDPQSARRFLAQYRASGGPLPDDELSWLGIAMRVWVQQDVRVSLAYAPSGGRYVALQSRAFHELPDHPSWLVTPP